jgi:uncharacterized protein YecE (DUF72 family)
LQARTLRQISGLSDIVITLETAFMERQQSHAVECAALPLIGCAGWSLPGTVKTRFPEEGSHLQRYAAVFPAVEINSSFYRPHKPDTYARWRDSVPDAFRFSAKVPKAITHEQRLRDVDGLLERFIAEVGNLGRNLGCLLAQLPPSLRFDAETAYRFFTQLRTRIDADIVCEPRHASWFTEEAAGMLAELGIGFVRADPPAVAHPVPETGPVYIRLHGSPVMYYSTYAEEVLDGLASELYTMLEQGKRPWCIFDNTAEGWAVPNALTLLAHWPQRA